MLCHSLQGFLEDGTNVVEADLQQHLGPYPFYFELDLIQPGVHSDLQVQEACELSKDGDVCPEILDRQLDPVDLELRDIQEHVDVLTGGRLFLSAVVVYRWGMLSPAHSSLLMVSLLERGVFPPRYMMRHSRVRRQLPGTPSMRSSENFPSTRLDE